MESEGESGRAPGAEVRAMTAHDEYFVGTCSHVGESAETDACGAERAAWLREMHGEGLRVFVALVGGEHAGFLHTMPLEVCPWGPQGRDLSVVPCLFVLPRFAGFGTGRALMRAAEEEALRQGKSALAVPAYAWDFWFMPTSFFERLGYAVAERRGVEALMWKALAAGAKPPTFLAPRYAFEPLAGVVVIDLFWNVFCQTSAIEARRVREVAAEFGERVVLREYQAESHDVLRRWGLPRAIYVNGREIGWGHEAPKDGIREAVAEALKSV